MRVRILAIALLITTAMVAELVAKERTPGLPELHRLYATNFADFALPDLTGEKRKTVVVSIRPTAKARKWQCVLRVLMQRGPVIELDLEHGLVAAPPLVAQFDEVEAQVRVFFLDELYHAQGSNGQYIGGFDLLSIESLLREISAQVSVQCEGERRLRERWKYLRSLD